MKYTSEFLKQVSECLDYMEKDIMLNMKKLLLTHSESLLIDMVCALSTSQYVIDKKIDQMNEGRIAPVWGIGAIVRLKEDIVHPFKKGDLFKLISYKDGIWIGLAIATDERMIAGSVAISESAAEVVA